MMAVIQDALDAGESARDRGTAGCGIRKTRCEARVDQDATRIPHPAPRLRRTPTLDLAHLPPDDPAVYKMLQEADTVGIFQVESRAQMATLPRLRPEKLLRHRRRGRDHPAGADRRADGASLSEAAAGGGAGRVSASVARADPEADAGRAAVPGAAAADGDGGGGILRRRGGGAAARVRVQAIREADAADRGQAARGDGDARGSPATPPKRSSGRSRRSRCTDFPSRTRRASRCWSTPARI